MVLVQSEVGERGRIEGMETGSLTGRSGRCDLRGLSRVPVTFLVPDGSCFEGKALQGSGQVIFVESKAMVPVGTDITIRVAPRDTESTHHGEWSSTEGTVVWGCPSVDHFTNREGFGVCLQGSWPELQKAKSTKGTG